MSVRRRVLIWTTDTFSYSYRSARALINATAISTGSSSAPARNATALSTGSCRRALKSAISEIRTARP